MAHVVSNGISHRMMDYKYPIKLNLTQAAACSCIQPVGRGEHIMERDAAATQIYADPEQIFAWTSIELGLCSPLICKATGTDSRPRYVSMYPCVVLNKPSMALLYPQTSCRFQIRSLTELCGNDP